MTDSWTDASHRSARPAVVMHAEADTYGRVYQAGGDQYIFEAPTPVSPSALRTLPRDTVAFTGRIDELRRLYETASRARAADGAQYTNVIVIEGMPGVGKTALAVHAAHEMTRDFPDGQLFLRMHAYTPGVAPIEPAEALEYLLMATGVAPEAVPTGTDPQLLLDARAAMWRDRLARKRVLLILDDVTGYEQIEPLLPGDQGCFVILTSRRRLAGQPDIISISLDTLPPDEAADLFCNYVGKHRPLPGPARTDVAKLVEMARFLPLAISLLSGKLISHPSWQVSDLVSDMAASRDKLPHLQAGDLAVAAAFDLSYRGLSTGRKRFFRRLGLSPGTDLDAYAAAALDGVTLSRAAEYLEALHNEYLLVETTHGRYTMHDLVREYVRTRLERSPDRGASTALGRLFDYYETTARLADRQLSQRGMQTSSASYSGAMPALGDRALAWRWMAAEIGNIMACAAHSVSRQQDNRILAFAAAVAGYLAYSGPWERAITLHEFAVKAARRQHNRYDEAAALTNLGIVQGFIGDSSVAAQTLNRALLIYGDLENALGQALILTKLGTILYQLDEYDEAAQALHQSLEIYTYMQDLSGQAEALNELGLLRFLEGDYRAAGKLLEQALDIFRATGNRLGEAWSLNRLGAVRYKTGDYRGARPLLEKALELYVDLGDRIGQGSALNRLGVVATLTGNYPTAFARLSKALDVCDSLGEKLGQANTLHSLGILQRMTGDVEAAAKTLQLCFDIYREINTQLGQADALAEFGRLWGQVGEHARGIEASRQALSIYLELGEKQGQAVALNALGLSLCTSGNTAEALQSHQRARALATSVDIPLEVAHALAGSSRCQLQRGSREEAIADLREALAIYERIGAAEAADARSQLAVLMSQADDMKGGPGGQQV